jgi:microcystin-dependent protein
MPYVGEIRMWAGNWAPNGWALCNGQVMPISENETLFVLIGTRYGGDGETTFALPNLQSRVVMHTNNSGRVGEMAGAEEVTLTTQQVPVHNHAYVAATALGTEPTPAGNVTAQVGALQWYRASSPSAQMSPQALAPTGGSQPHTNMIPFLTVSYIISLYGIFPSPT